MQPFIARDLLIGCLKALRNRPAAATFIRAAEACGGHHGAAQNRKTSAAGLMRDVRLIKRHAHDTEEPPMQFTFAIETSQPCGASFRLALGITIPLGLVWMVLSLVGLS